MIGRKNGYITRICVESWEYGKREREVSAGVLRDTRDDTVMDILIKCEQVLLSSCSIHDEPLSQGFISRSNMISLLLSSISRLYLLIDRIEKSFI